MEDCCWFLFSSIYHFLVSLSFVMPRTQVAGSEFDIVTFGLQMLLAKVQISKKTVKSLKSGDVG